MDYYQFVEALSIQIVSRIAENRRIQSHLTEAVVNSAVLSILDHVRIETLPGEGDGNCSVMFIPVVIPRGWVVEDSLLARFSYFLATNYSDPAISSAAVAEYLEVPVYKMSRLVRDWFNVSFPDYLNQARIISARQLLYETKLTAAEVGYRVGYTSPSSFSRSFKRLTGQTPIEYREKYKKMAT